MEVNLSNEMIDKIAYLSYGRIYDLQEKEKLIKDSIAVGTSQIKRKQSHLKTIQKALSDAKEVYELFLELSNQI